MTGNATTTAIITGGLTCASPACHGIITTHFSLLCTDITPTTDEGGGPYPGDAWNKFDGGSIQDFFKPTTPDGQPYVVPWEQEAEYFKKRKLVVLKVKIGDKEIEKGYAVPKSKAKVIIKVLDLINATVKNLKAMVTGFRRVATTAIVSVKNFKVKAKKK